MGLLVIYRWEALISSLRSDESFNIMHDSWTISTEMRNTKMPHFNVFLKLGKIQGRGLFIYHWSVNTLSVIHGKGTVSCSKITARHRWWYLSGVWKLLASRVGSRTHLNGRLMCDTESVVMLMIIWANCLKGLFLALEWLWRFIRDVQSAEGEFKKMQVAHSLLHFKMKSIHY